MTPATFKAWRTRQGLTQTAAAEALGCGRRSLHNWETGHDYKGRPRPIPRYIALACAAVAMGLIPLPD